MSRHMRGDGLTLELARSLHLVVAGMIVRIEHITMDGHPAIRVSSRDCSLVDEPHVLRGSLTSGGFRGAEVPRVREPIPLRVCLRQTF